MFITALVKTMNDLSAHLWESKKRWSPDMSRQNHLRNLLKKIPYDLVFLQIIKTKQIHRLTTS